MEKEKVKRKTKKKVKKKVKKKMKTKMVAEQEDLLLNVLIYQMTPTMTG